MVIEANALLLAIGRVIGSQDEPIPNATYRLVSRQALDDMYRTAVDALKFGDDDLRAKFNQSRSRGAAEACSYFEPRKEIVNGGAKKDSGQTEVVPPEAVS